MNKDLSKWLGKRVFIKIEKPIGYEDEKGMYLCNYGYIPDTISGDGEEIDVYLLGEYNSLEVDSFRQVYIIALVNREDDVEQKLVAVPNSSYKYTANEIRALLNFRERYYKSNIILYEKPYICNCCGKEIPNDNEHIFDIQEFHKFKGTGGYGSEIGDGITWEFGVCDQCFSEWINTFVVEPKYTSRWLTEYYGEFKGGSYNK